MSKLKSCWLGLSIGSKMRMFVILLLLVIVSAAGFNFYTLQFSIGDVSQILKEISRCETAQEAMHDEAESFRLFVRVPSENNLSNLNQAVSHCRSSILLLPYDYEEIGAERYARTWRARNAYKSYSEQRDSIRDRLLTFGSSYNVATALEEDKDALDLLYQVYDMQTYNDCQSRFHDESACSFSSGYGNMHTKAGLRKVRLLSQICICLRSGITVPGPFSPGKFSEGNYSDPATRIHRHGRSLPQGRSGWEFPFCPSLRRSRQ